MRLSQPMKKNGETVLFKPSPPKLTVGRVWSQSVPAGVWPQSSSAWRFVARLSSSGSGRCHRAGRRGKSCQLYKAGSEEIHAGVPEIGFIIGEPKSGSMALSSRVVVGMELLWC